MAFSSQKFMNNEHQEQKLLRVCRFLSRRSFPPLGDEHHQLTCVHFLWANPFPAHCDLITWPDCLITISQERIQRLREFRKSDEMYGFSPEKHTQATYTHFIDNERGSTDSLGLSYKPPRLRSLIKNFWSQMPSAGSGNVSCISLSIFVSIFFFNSSDTLQMLQMYLLSRFASCHFCMQLKQLLWRFLERTLQNDVPLNTVTFCEAGDSERLDFCYEAHRVTNFPSYNITSLVMIRLACVLKVLHSS